MNLFQFHTGSIKSCERDGDVVARKGFNSILVRLKERAQRVRELREQVSIPYWFD